MYKKILVLLLTITLSSISNAQISKEEFIDFIGKEPLKIISFNAITVGHSSPATDKVSHNEVYIIRNPTIIEAKLNGIWFKSELEEDFYIPYDRIKLLELRGQTLSIYND